MHFKCDAAVENTTFYEYDSVNRLTRRRDSWTSENAVLSYILGGTITIPAGVFYTYDGAGNILTETDTSYNWIANWQELNMQTFDWEFAYDGQRNYRRTADQWSQAWGVVTSVTNQYSYTAEGYLSTVTESAGGYSTDSNWNLLPPSQYHILSQYSYTYDSLGRQLTVSNDGTPNIPTVVLTSAYDNLGRRVGLSATIDGVVDFQNTYIFDAASQLTRITQSGAIGGNTVADKRVDIDYDDAGRVWTISRYAELDGSILVAESVYSYDNANRLVGLSHNHDETSFNEFEWNYDAASRVTYMSSVDGTSAYTYDATNQLVAADHSYQDDEAYDYDANGNRDDTSAGNQLTGLENLDIAIAYTDSGERYYINNYDTSSSRSYSWDSRHRLLSVFHSATSGGTTSQDIATYLYDSYDRLIGKKMEFNITWNSTDETNEWYVYDGQTLIFAFDANGDITHRYLHGPVIDQVFADENAIGEVLWPLQDNQQTVRDVVQYDAGEDETTVVQHIQYDSFGLITDVSNTAVPIFFAYTGRIWDADVQLYNYRARWYDPHTHTFISPDPLRLEAGDTNFYRYVGNSPTNYTDPSGLFPGGGGALSGGNYNLSRQPPSKNVKAGLDIGDALRKVLRDVEIKFKALPYAKKVELKNSLFNDKDRATSGAWDITPLIADAKDARFIWGTARGEWGTDPSNLKVVTVDGRCYWGPAVNYVLWGKINRLVYDYFPRQPATLTPANAACYAKTGRLSADQVDDTHSLAWTKRVAAAWRFMKSTIDGGGIDDPLVWAEVGWTGNWGGAGRAEIKRMGFAFIPCPNKFSGTLFWHVGGIGVREEFVTGTKPAIISGGGEE